jgi:hypothetical protein
MSQKLRCGRSTRAVILDLVIRLRTESARLQAEYTGRTELGSNRARSETGQDVLFERLAMERARIA